MLIESGKDDMNDAGPRVDVIAAESGRAFRDFLELPYRISGGNPNWVPPLRLQQGDVLDRKGHPFYAHAQARFFVARRDGEPVGRIAAISDDVHNEVHGERTTHFGFFECVDDPAVAAALLARVEACAAEWGHDMVRGPFNPSVNEEIGLQIDAFDQPSFVMIPGNPPYYARLIEAAGYAKNTDLYCYLIEAGHLSERLAPVAAAARARNGFRYRKMSRRNFDRDAAAIWQVYNKAWEKNWYWVPATEAEFQHLARTLKLIADFDLTYIAETEAGEPVGVCIAIPNVYEATRPIRDGRLFPFGWLRLLWGMRPGAIRSVRVLIMGVLEPYRGRGVDMVMIHMLVTEGLRKGYRRAELSQVLEGNVPMIHVAEAVGGRRYKTHRMYEKRVG